MRLEENLYGEIIQKRKICNKYICNIKYWDFPTIGSGGFGNDLGKPKFKPIEPLPKVESYKPFPDLHKDFEGNSWGKSFGKADYVKILNNGDKLSVHAPNGIITGAKLNDKPIDNYRASIWDLGEGEVKKNTGGDW